MKCRGDQRKVPRKSKKIKMEKNNLMENQATVNCISPVRSHHVIHSQDLEDEKIIMRFQEEKRRFLKDHEELTKEVQEKSKNLEEERKQFELDKKKMEKYTEFQSGRVTLNVGGYK